MLHNAGHPRGWHTSLMVPLIPYSTITFLHLKMPSVCVAETGVVRKQTGYDCNCGYTCGSRKRVSNSIIVNQASFVLDFRGKMAEGYYGVPDFVDYLEMRLGSMQ